MLSSLGASFGDSAALSQRSTRNLRPHVTLTCRTKAKENESQPSFWFKSGYRLVHGCMRLDLPSKQSACTYQTDMDFNLPDVLQRRWKADGSPSEASSVFQYDCTSLLGFMEVFLAELAIHEHHTRIWHPLCADVKPFVVRETLVLDEKLMVDQTTKLSREFKKSKRLRRSGVPASLRSRLQPLPREPNPTAHRGRRHASRRPGQSKSRHCSWCEEGRKDEPTPQSECHLQWDVMQGQGVSYLLTPGCGALRRAHPLAVCVSQKPLASGEKQKTRRIAFRVRRMDHHEHSLSIFDRREDKHVYALCWQLEAFLSTTAFL